MQYYGQSGNTYTTAQLLGSGGEGDVFTVTEAPTSVAKVYHPHRAVKERLDKLQWMVAQPPDDPCAHLGHVSISWPTEIFYADRQRTQFTGFLMPRLSGSKKLADAYHTPTRRRQMPGFTWQYLICTARNLASSIQALHDKGYVVGDLNESNALILPSALTSVIDTDSFQVTTPARTFRSSVGKPDYTAPESQLRDFTTFDRTPHDDCFALAVLTFLLLMEGRHPFDGVAVSAPDCPEIGERIRANWFRMAHAEARGGVCPPPKCPPFAMLSPQVRDLFIRCFVDGEKEPTKRPSAIEWMRVLNTEMSSLVTCTRNPKHRYGQHLQECPWCERIRTLQIADSFPQYTPTQQPIQQPAQTPVQQPQPPAVPRRRSPSPPITIGFPPGGVPGRQPSIPTPPPVTAGAPLAPGVPLGTPAPPIPGSGSIPASSSVPISALAPSSAAAPGGTPIHPTAPVAPGRSVPPAGAIPPGRAMPPATPVPTATTVQGAPRLYGVALPYP